jgi:FKBP-type peptidyl-prolyl cis-trans isomerase FkpA
MKTVKTLSVLLFLTTLFSQCKKSEGYDAEKQLQIDEQLIKDYLASKNITNAVRDDSGVYYIVIESGAGNVTYQNNTLVNVSYTGRLLNGQVFDSKDAYQAYLGDLIIGWRIGIPKIKPGGKIRLFVPSLFGYGQNAQPGIPANSVLDFDIQLKNIGF